MNSANPLLVKAIEYSSRGYSVIPIKKNKVPAIPSWLAYQKTAATDAQLEKWWSAKPISNIGICTGKVSGLTVVDIDTSDDAKITPLTAFPPTYTVKTPSGGYHLYYQYDPSIQQTANTFPQFPHVDIRNDGGYVIAPPSVADYLKHKKRITGAYKVLKNLPIAPFPTALFSPSSSASKTGANKGNVNSILNSFDAMAEGDGRNNAMAKFIGRVLRAHLPADYLALALPMALEANKKFKQPLPAKEVETIFHSIAKRESKKPLADVEFIKTDKGVIIANTENVYRTIKADPVLHDQFRNNIFVGMAESRFNRETWETIQRIDVIKVRNHLMSQYPHFTKIPHGDVEDAIIRAAEDSQVSPPVEWLESLTWDQTPRLNAWISKTYGTKNDDYHQTVGSNWMKGLVKRLKYPGSKFDYVLVLEGEQGIRKSTSLAILGGDWHLETVFAPNNKDFFQLLSGNAIVEFSEGETLSRTEAKLLKAVITMQFDKYRPPYERSVKNFPRQCVFAMTTNQEQYLKDETGNRRWLPVACKGQVNTDWLTENRDQLFAEAYYRVVELKETTYEFPVEETKRQQEQRRIHDPNEELITDWYEQLTEEARREGITILEVYTHALHRGFPNKPLDRWTEMMIGGVLRTMGLNKRRAMRGDGKQRMRWFFGDTPVEEKVVVSPLAF